MLISEERILQRQLMLTLAVWLAAIPMMVNLAEILKANRWATEISEPSYILLPYIVPTKDLH